MAKRNTVMPPITESGIDVMIPAIFENTPIRMSTTPVAIPARLDAHLVRAMTPLFWENVVFGIAVMNPASMLQKASESNAP